MKLFDAIDENDLPTVWALIAEKRDLETIDDVTGLTPLALSAEMGRTEIVRCLLEAEVDPDRGGSTTPLEAAVLEGDEEVVRLLLGAGADVNRSVADGFTPLMTAATTGDVRIARMLLESGAQARARNADGATAIDLAFEAGFAALARELQSFSHERFEQDRAESEARERERREQERAQKRARVEEARRRREAEEAARAALETQQREASESSGDELSGEASGGSGVEPKDESSSVPPSDTAREAMETSADRAATGSTAVASTEPASTEPDPAEPASTEPDPTEPASTDEPAAPSLDDDLDAATRFLFGDAAAPVRAKGLDPDRLKGIERFVVLLRRGEISKARQMIEEESFDFEERDERGRTALMYAAASGNLELAEMLLDRGAEIDALETVEPHESALVIALHYPNEHRLAIVRLLIERGADLTMRYGEHGIQPLMVAALDDVYLDNRYDGFAAATRLLIAEGADLEAVDERGNTVWRAIKRNALGAPTSSPHRRRLFQMLRVLESEGALQIASHLV